MRIFNLNVGKGGTAIAWKLNIENAVSLLGELHDEEYLLSDYESNRVCYKIHGGYRTKPYAVSDYITGERLELAHLVDHEERLYGSAL